MMQRVPRYPPLHARLLRLEEGPPMYRMLGYADKNNTHGDLCSLFPAAYYGPFAFPRFPTNQPLPFGPGRFGLPSMPLAYTTHYWDDRRMPCDFYCRQTPYHKLHYMRVQPPRPEEVIFPEMAVPGTGVQSTLQDSGLLYKSGLAPPRSFSDEAYTWDTLNISSSPLML
ncbi:uncharacterized protein LOC106051060 isoform X2 [Biomphalaria glabrata]|uniref:Uncharacterized protein LOC106051060 isoform X2 n=1 Tax=Biomphalaria glabrata TaxID=6526 RepID=A0A9U8DVA2_BIOGL|nr:uncharacterized protein LOC106051060 isoform X2 [Biomphalaria glabrata]